MKQRTIWKMFLLEVVTFGIYRLYWFVKTRRELMARTNIKIPSPWFLAAPLLLVLVVIGFMITSFTGTISAVSKSDQCMMDHGYTTYSSSASYSAYQDTLARDAVQRTCNDQSGVSKTASILPSIVIGLAFLAYLPLTAWWLWHYCQAVEEVTGEKVSRILGLVVFLVVPDGIDILIVQDYFNKVPEAQGVPQS